MSPRGASPSLLLFRTTAHKLHKRTHVPANSLCSVLTETRSISWSVASSSVLTSPLSECLWSPLKRSAFLWTCVLPPEHSLVLLSFSSGSCFIVWSEVAGLTLASSFRHLLSSGSISLTSCSSFSSLSLPRLSLAQPALAALWPASFQGRGWS